MRAMGFEIRFHSGVTGPSPLIPRDQASRVMAAWRVFSGTFLANPDII
jgi:hypothetical protein